MASKRQTTMAKLARERLVQERRALKREKKQAAVAARAARAAGETDPSDQPEPADHDDRASSL